MSVTANKELKPMDSEEKSRWEKISEIYEQWEASNEGNEFRHSLIVSLGIAAAGRDWRTGAENPHPHGTVARKAWQSGFNYAYDWMAEAWADAWLMREDDRFIAAGEAR